MRRRGKAKSRTTPSNPPPHITNNRVLATLNAGPIGRASGWLGPEAETESLADYFRSPRKMPLRSALVESNHSPSLAHGIFPPGYFCTVTHCVRFTSPPQRMSVCLVSTVATQLGHNLYMNQK